MLLWKHAVRNMAHLAIYVGVYVYFNTGSIANNKTKELLLYVLLCGEECRYTNIVITWQNNILKKKKTLEELSKSGHLSHRWGLMQMELITQTLFGHIK